METTQILQCPSCQQQVTYTRKRLPRSRKFGIWINPHTTATGQQCVMGSN